MNDFGTFRRHFWALPLEGAMMAGGVLTVLAGDYFHTLTSVFTLGVSFAPLAFERVFKVKIAPFFQVSYVMFIFLSMFCGEVLKFYASIRFWDASMHAFSGAAVVFGVVLWLRLLLRRKEIRFPLGMQLLFAFSFSIMIAAMWEIVEFCSDRIFGTSSQDRSLHDTMTDLLSQTVGAVGFVLLYRLFQRGRRIAGMKWMIDRFEKLNP